MMCWDDYPVAFGERFKAYREANNLTLQQLEVITNIGSPALSRVERGHEFPSSSMLHALAKCKGCDIDWLVLGRMLTDDEHVYFADTFVQENSLSPNTIKVTATYMVHLLQMKLASAENASLPLEKYDEYMFNLKLAELICERYGDSAEEGQVISSIRKVLGITMNQMDDILEMKSGRCGYMEKHGGVRATELVKLYDKLRVNPAFVLSGQCERMIIRRV